MEEFQSMFHSNYSQFLFLERKKKKERKGGGGVKKEFYIIFLAGARMEIKYLPSLPSPLRPLAIKG